MNGDRFFLDTSFMQALLNAKDQHHDAATRLAPRLQTAREVWTTEAVLVEIANALSALNRAAAVRIVEHAYRTANTRVVSVDTALLRRALQLYRDRSDKTWGLTDCISFVVMRDHGLSEALSSDGDFEQAGFVALLR
jgi:predicted nucleic acid-binding protein